MIKSILAIVSKVTNWLPNKAEHRRNVYDKLKKERSRLIRQKDSLSNRRNLARIDKRLYDLENAALNE